MLNIHHLIFILVWTECGRAKSETYKSDTGAIVFSKCPIDKRVRFSCGNMALPRFTSNEIPPLDFRTSSCIKFDTGALNPSGGDYILSIDNTRDPKCSEIDAYYDIFMDFGTRWGCKGTSSAHLLPGWWFSVSYLKDEGK